MIPLFETRRNAYGKNGRIQFLRCNDPGRFGVRGQVKAIELVGAAPEIKGELGTETFVMLWPAACAWTIEGLGLATSYQLESKFQVKWGEVRTSKPHSTPFSGRKILILDYQLLSKSVSFHL